MTWQEQAACLDKTWMADPRGRRAEARAVCKGCPVLRPCKGWILSDEGVAAEVPGIVAGLSPEQRDLVECACGAVTTRPRSRRGQCWSCYTSHETFPALDDYLEAVS